MGHGILEITDSQFSSEVLDAKRPVLIYFWATWCEPCRLVSPAIAWAAETYGDRLKVVKLEVDPNPETVKAYKVEGVPALRLFNANANLTWSHEGAISKPQLQSQLAAHLGAA
ncbi:MAG: thioredoxin family protein [Cyanobacteria bacterium J06641_5]